ncbi:MAG: ATP-binding cassette domain-containing protein, partial [Acutalibacteraceae bacterium]
MLTVFHLTKKYKKVVANNDLNFTVASGEIAVLVGPNGAGKSTSIKCIAGLLRYEGEIYIDQFQNKTIEAKKHFGYIPEIPAPFEL